MTSNKYGAVLLGNSDEKGVLDNEPGFAKWIENGKVYKAPKVDHKKFGPHDYHQPYMSNMGTCQCGCYMGSSSSAGDCDPFGACPENPNPFTEV